MTNPHPEDLKPCPFCGGDELSHGWDSPGIDGSATTGNVQCHSCDALLWRPTEAEAITAWNQRATLTQPAGDVVEALRAVEAAMLRGGDGQIGDYGWSITKLNEARPLIRAALSSTPVASGEVGQKCVGCEGTPAPGNNPCAICGLTTPTPDDVGKIVAWLREEQCNAEIFPGVVGEADIVKGIADRLERGDWRDTPSDQGWRDAAEAPKDRQCSKTTNTYGVLGLLKGQGGRCSRKATYTNGKVSFCTQHAKVEATAHAPARNVIKPGFYKIGTPTPEASGLPGDGRVG